MGLKDSLVFFIPDTVRDVEILRIGSACYPHGGQGEPETVRQAMHWATASDWGAEKLASMGVTWTRHKAVTAAPQRHTKAHRRNTMNETRKNPLEIGVQRLHPDAVIPAQANPEDAGCDLYSTSAAYLNPGERALFSTGLALSIPEGYVGLIHPRSGLALNKGIDVLGGVIDAGYRGDVGVILLNTGQSAVRIDAGERIAQLLVQPVMGVDFRERELAGSVRGAGGFGSTGTH